MFQIIILWRQTTNDGQQILSQERCCAMTDPPCVSFGRKGPEDVRANFKRLGEEDDSSGYLTLSCPC